MAILTMRLKRSRQDVRGKSSQVGWRRREEGIGDGVGRGETKPLALVDRCLTPRKYAVPKFRSSTFGQPYCLKNQQYATLVWHKDEEQKRDNAHWSGSLSLPSQKYNYIFSLPLRKSKCLRIIYRRPLPSLSIVFVSSEINRQGERERSAIAKRQSNAFCCRRRQSSSIARSSRHRRRHSRPAVS